MARAGIITAAPNTTTTDHLFLPKRPEGYVVFVYGTFDGATATPKISPDGGTTLINLKDPNDRTTDLTFTANDSFWVPGGEFYLALSNNGAGSVSMKAI